jgi:trans-aconitate methyltransferase
MCEPDRVSGGKVSWADYNDAQMTRQPRPLTARVIGLAGPGDGRRALDLGCGSGVETRALVAAGWHVTAVDADPSMPPRLADLVARGDVDTEVADVREVAFGPVDLVHSSLCLPFVPRADFAQVWERIVHDLRPGGWLAVDLFGVRDDWAAAPELNFHDRAGVDALVRGLDDVEVLEEERDAPSFNGAVKHWHVFHVIARRPA